MIYVSESDVHMIAEALCYQRGGQPYNQVPGTPIQEIDLAKQEVKAFMEIYLLLKERGFYT